MFIVITGLDGSGTSTIAQKLAELDCGSTLLKTPSREYASREMIDDNVRGTSRVAHFLYYLSSTVYMSDYIKKFCDYRSKNVYCVRYLIDTTVSNRVAGLDIGLDYNIYGNKLLVPDLTIFVSIDEKIREKRISERGKSQLDIVLDDATVRGAFLEQFRLLLPTNTIYVENSSEEVDKTIGALWTKIKEYQDK